MTTFAPRPVFMGASASGQFLYGATAAARIFVQAGAGWEFQGRADAKRLMPNSWHRKGQGARETSLTGSAPPSKSKQNRPAVPPALHLGAVLQRSNACSGCVLTCIHPGERRDRRSLFVQLGQGPYRRCSTLGGTPCPGTTSHPGGGVYAPHCGPRRPESSADESGLTPSQGRMMLVVGGGVSCHPCGMRHCPPRIGTQHPQHPRRS